MRNIFAMTLALMLCSVVAHAEKEWWAVANDGERCIPPGEVTPQSVVTDHPECVTADYDKARGLLFVDCKKSDLGTNLVFADSLKACNRARKLIKKLRSQGVKWA